MTVKEEILEAVNLFPGITDAEIARRYGRIHQAINAAGRELAAKGYISRRPNPDKNGNIGNYPGKKAKIQATYASVEKTNAAGTNSPGGSMLGEDAIKALLKNWLEEQGWSVNVAWGRTHGVDIEAVKDDERWLIEAKGPGSREAMRHNYFLSILGETLQRMDDEKARYSIAFPDMQVYRDLWKRLPALAKQRTKIDMLLVSVDGKVSVHK